MMQKIKWICNLCGWSWRVDYQPSPENMDTMLGEIMPRHSGESPNCSATTSDIMCHHVEEKENGS